VSLLALDVAHADWSVPFHYINPFPRVGCSDIYHMLQHVQALCEQGWSGQSTRIGFPGTQDDRDFPAADLLHHALLWLISRGGWSFGFTINSYYVLGFALTGASAAGVARQLGYSVAGSLAIAVLYACLPYHFMRGQSHLLLSAYFVVPCTVLTAVWLAESKPFTVRRRLTPTGWFVVLTGGLTGLAGVYYAAFALLFIVCGAGVATTLGPRRLSRDVLVPLLSIVAGLGICAVPYVMHRITAGPNSLAVIRPGTDIEESALKLVQMVIPVPRHRLPMLAAVTASYENASPFVNENAAAALGIVGTAGLILLLAVSAGFCPKLADSRRIRILASFNLVGLLYATHGGFGVLPALVTTPLLRGSSRVVVYLAFFSLLAICAWVESAKPWICSRSPKLAWWIVMACLTVGGLWDQVSPSFRPHHRAIRARHADDARFGAELERTLPPMAAVFQLPFVSYPEGGFGDYQHFRPVLHTRTLRFSYGAMRGRQADALNNELANRLVSRDDSAIEALRRVEYLAILIDRAIGHDPAFERWLGATLGSPWFQSSDARYAVFDLRK